MSSPNIKLQSLMRRYKNGIKDVFDKKKIIEYYTYCITLANSFEDTNYLYHTITANDCIYTLADILDEVQSNAERPASLPNSPIEIFQWEDDIQQLPNIPELKDEYQESVLDNFVGNDGILSNLYNVELCNANWLINIYLFNRLHLNFANTDKKIKIRSLHINCLPGSALSAMHHILYNSKITDEYTIDWDWLGTIYQHSKNKYIDDGFHIQDTLKSKFGQRLLNLFSRDIATFDNINFIIHETVNKIGKINLFSVDYKSSDTINDYLAYVIICSKLLENSCIVKLEMPPIQLWDARWICILLLYSFMFQELYIFKFQLNSDFIYLICKNRKKLTINNDIIFKKLMLILQNPNMNTHNIFTKSVFDLPNTQMWMSIIKRILRQCNTGHFINLMDIIDDLNDVLAANHDTFL